jgi:hypothetical protein
MLNKGVWYKTEVTLLSQHKYRYKSGQVMQDGDKAFFRTQDGGTVVLNFNHVERIEQTPIKESDDG